LYTDCTTCISNSCTYNFNLERRLLADTSSTTDEASSSDATTLCSYPARRYLADPVPTTTTTTAGVAEEQDISQCMVNESTLFFFFKFQNSLIIGSFSFQENSGLKCFLIIVLKHSFLIIEKRYFAKMKFFFQQTMLSNSIHVFVASRICNIIFQVFVS